MEFLNTIILIILTSIIGLFLFYLLVRLGTKAFLKSWYEQKAKFFLKKKEDK